MAGAIPKQTQEDIVPPAPIPLGFRLGAVLLTAPVAVALHVILAGPFGLDLQIPAEFGGSALKTLPLIETARFVLGISVVAYISVLLLERAMGVERGRRAWSWVALGLYAFSLLPVLTMDTSAGSKWGLVVLHSVVALVLIPSMTAAGTPGDHPTTNLPDPLSPGDVGATEIHPDQH